METMPTEDIMANNQPAAKFRIGAVTATVWENEGSGRTFYSVNLSRSYKDGDDWKEADNFNHGDLLNAAKVLKRAEQYISDNS